MADRRPAAPALLRAAALAAGPMLSACSPAALLNATIDRAGLTVTHDVPYEPGPRHTADIWRPADAAGLPVVVFLYGGNWRTGTKTIYPFVAATLARQGYVVIVPDYRLVPAVRFPGFLRDCAAATAWSLSHAALYGGNAHTLFLMGHSAGAYNAAMLALDPQWLHAAGAARGDISGFVGLAGPYDFLPITSPDVREVFAPVQDGPASQPISFVDGHAPPMLLLAGADDRTVLPRNSRALAAAVVEHGGQAVVRVYPGLGHVGLITAFAPLFQWRAPVLRDVVKFLKENKK